MHCRSQKAIDERSRISRRRMIQVAGAGAIGPGLFDWPISQSLRAAEPSDSTALEPLNRFPRMVQEFFVERVRRAEKVGIERRSRLETKVDAESYVRDVRRKIQDSFGPMAERTPLKPRITGALERDDSVE